MLCAAPGRRGVPTSQRTNERTNERTPKKWCNVPPRTVNNSYCSLLLFGRASICFPSRYLSPLDDAPRPLPHAPLRRGGGGVQACMHALLSGLFFSSARHPRRQWTDQCSDWRSDLPKANLSASFVSRHDPKLFPPSLGRKPCLVRPLHRRAVTNQRVYLAKNGFSVRSSEIHTTNSPPQGPYGWNV